MTSDAQVIVAKLKDGYRFEPVGTEITKPNIIFYPGGLVEPESYSPLAREMAEQGHRVYIANMPINLAILVKKRLIPLSRNILTKRLLLVAIRWEAHLHHGMLRSTMRSWKASFSLLLMQMKEGA